MERELWPVLYQLVREVGRDVSQKHVIYPPWVIAAVILWAAVHDRPVSWACQPKHWSTTRCCPLQLPSASTVSRRARRLSVFWRALEDRCRQSQWRGLLSFVDGKPLFVGGCTKDPEARRGYGAGGFGWGYKLHAIWSNRCLPEGWDVTSLNASEPVVAQALVAMLPAGGYLLADGSYETNPLAEAAGRAGYQLVAAPRRANAGQGHRRHSPFRLRGLDLQTRSFGQRLFRERYRIELTFAHATSFGGGLADLPPWVRRLHRVRTWVWAKLLINAVRILTRH